MTAKSQPAQRDADEPKQLDSVQLAQLVRARMHELGVSQPELALRVARQLDEPVVGQSAVSRWLDDLSAVSCARVFAIEDALDYVPGSLSHHLGFLPARAQQALTVLDAIERDPTLSRAQRQALIGAYYGVTGAYRR